jgi:hypothetical protein
MRLVGIIRVKLCAFGPFGAYCIIFFNKVSGYFKTCGLVCVCVWQGARHNSIIFVTLSTIILTTSSISPCHVHGFLICGHFIPHVHGAKQKVQNKVFRRLLHLLCGSSTVSHLNHTFFFLFLRKCFEKSKYFLEKFQVWICQSTLKRTLKRNAKPWFRLTRGGMWRKSGTTVPVMQVTWGHDGGLSNWRGCHIFRSLRYIRFLGSFCTFLRYSFFASETSLHIVSVCY